MTSTEIFENNLLFFKIMKRYGDKAQCRCPAHDDKHASLTITKGRKCTLFYCHAGCTVDEVLNAAGLEKKDTFYDVEPRSPNWKAYVEGREKLKQFTITFLLTVVMPLQRLGLRVRKLFMVNCRMTVLHTV